MTTYPDLPFDKRANSVRRKFDLALRRIVEAGDAAELDYLDVLINSALAHFRNSRPRRPAKPTAAAVDAFLADIVAKGREGCGET